MILLTLLYPISETRSYEIRAELDKRRSRLGSTYCRNDRSDQIFQWRRYSVGV